MGKHRWHLVFTVTDHLYSQLYQISLGLAYLHTEGIVHGDLHGVSLVSSLTRLKTNVHSIVQNNILVDDSGNARLIDFGMSLIADSTAYNYASMHGGGAVRFTAPEIIDPDEFDIPDGSTRPTYASDTYSYACICVEVRSCSYHPSHGYSCRDFLSSYTRDNLRSWNGLTTKSGAGS